MVLTYIPRLWQPGQGGLDVGSVGFEFLNSMMSLRVWPIWLNSRVTKPHSISKEKCLGEM